MRLRKNETIRKMLRDTRLNADNFIMPFFAVEGRNIKLPIKNFPGVYRLSVDKILKEVAEIQHLGIPAVLLFGICEKKDTVGSKAWDKNGILQRAVREIKKRFPGIAVISDVCLCGYKTDGHCGIIRKQSIDIETTLNYLSKIALSHAEAGCDFVAPSAMMGGQVKAIRDALDKDGFKGTGIFAYSAKFSSNFYGPFREALDSSPRPAARGQAKFGDRKSYQIDYSNAKSALTKIEQDISEGADIVMVKPALAYLDIIKSARAKFGVPIAAYNVSGEYSMVKFASSQKIINERDTVLEILTAIKRAGADLIITYHAKDAAKWLNVRELPSGSASRLCGRSHSFR